MVKSSEMQWWKELTPFYLTEESGDSNDEMTITEDKLPWRSQCELLFFCFVLFFVSDFLFFHSKVWMNLNL